VVVRILILAAAVATVGVIGLLVFNDDEPTRDREQASAAPDVPAPTGPDAPAPRALPDVETRARNAPRDPATQDALRRFVADCAASGDEAVAELVGRLRDRPDVKFFLPWRFKEGRLAEYPTLRAAYLDALSRIPGEAATTALREILDLTGSIEETALISFALTERGESRWVQPALERIGQGFTPANRAVHEHLLALAVKTDPAETAARLVAAAPRAGQTADPQVLAGGLTLLPLMSAMSTARELLEDPAITGKAKGRYLEAFCNRSEPEVYAGLRDMLSRGEWTEERRVEIAFAASRGSAFFRDAIEHGRAKARNSGDVAAIRARYDRRLTELESLMRAALGPELFDSDDPRARSLRRSLAGHQTRLK